MRSLYCLMRHSEKRGRIRPFRVARITRKHAFASSDDLMRRRTISPSRAGVGVFRLYLAPHELGSAVRNAYEQYKDAPLSGFRKCKEKEPCTVNVSEKLPRNTSPSRSIHAKSFNTHHSRLRTPAHCHFTGHSAGRQLYNHFFQSILPKTMDLPF